MFGAFTKFFKKSEPPPAPAHPTGLPFSQRADAALPKDRTASKPAVPRPLPTRPAGADCLTIQYSAIIKVIPQELWGKLAPAGLAGYNFTISRKSVLEQLPHGSVKVSFGELRRGAPPGSFLNTPAEDGRLVDLPLSEILVQLHPDSFARRSDQARIEVSDEVPDLFGAKGERLAPLRVMEKKEVANTSTLTRQNVSALAVPKPTAPTTPAPPVPAHSPVHFAGLPAFAAAQAAPPPSATVPKPAASPIRLPAVPSSPLPAAFPRPSAPVAPPLPRPAAGLSPQPSRPLPRPALPKPPAMPTPGVFRTAAFFIGLDVVAENWPEGVRQELAQLKIPDAKVALPPVEVCEGLKRGRIQYAWRTLRSWIQPTPVYASPSPHDDLVLELPLRTLTPLFLDFIRANPINRLAADAENITEFFRKAGQASGTSPDLLQPLFDPPPPPPARPQPARPMPTPGGTTPPVLPSMAAAAAAAAFSAPPVPFSTAAASGVASELAASAARAPFTEVTLENGLVCLPLTLIANGWPEPVLHDIAQFGLAGARVEIPLADLQAGMKAGRIEFVWRDLCAWLNPPSKPAHVSINGENRLLLPLSLVAPLFLKSRGAAQGRRKTRAADSIPDLFSATGKPQPQPPAAAEPAVGAVAAPAVEPAAPSPSAAVPAAPAMAPAPRKAPTNLCELFNEPNKKTWTPNEIVQRTVQLPNVAGALIALQDGLLVASNMPPDLKTETIAAFVPQIFGRLNQYSKELQMGETKAVSFTVEVGTVHVHNAGIIYFAAFSRPGKLLPLAELQLIAGELSRHTK